MTARELTTDELLDLALGLVESSRARRRLARAALEGEARVQRRRKAKP